MEEKKYMAKKVSPSGQEYSEELTHSQVCEMLLSAGFMSMLNRMSIGEVLYYNDIKIEFKRTA